MKEFLEKWLGKADDAEAAVEGEVHDGIELLKRTFRYLKYWAGISVVLLGFGMWMCWSGASERIVDAAITFSWVFSNIVLGAVLWNTTLLGMIVAVATGAGDELFGARFPDVKPATIKSYVQQACGWLVWVEFLHLTAMLLPVEAWRSPELTITAFMAISVLFVMTLAGWLTGKFGRFVMYAVAAITLTMFVGRNIPGVHEYSASVATDAVRKLTRHAAERDLKGLPEDLTGRKMAELAELQKSAITRCGKFACNANDAAMTSQLERDIAELGVSNAAAPGEADDSSGTSSAPTQGQYSEHVLPPPPAVTTASY